MTYAAHHRDFVPYFPYQTSTGSNAVTNKASVLRRIVDAIFEVASEAGRSRHRPLPRQVGRAPHR